MDALTVGPCTIRLVQGDITEQEVAAIVNAANSTLLGGGGVDGAIHRRGGPEILAECKRIRAETHTAGLSTGAAVSTTAGALKARRVIHTVGPIWRGGDAGEPEQLASAYRRSLECAAAEGLRTIAFPSISTGAYGYPVEAAALTALSAVRDYLRQNTSFDEVRLVLFSAADLATYGRALQRVAVR